MNEPHPLIETVVLPSHLDLHDLVEAIHAESFQLEPSISGVGSAYAIALARVQELGTLIYRCFWIASFTQVFDENIGKNRHVSGGVHTTLFPESRADQEIAVSLEDWKPDTDLLHQGALDRLNALNALPTATPLHQGARDLALQTAISIWSAFETFVSDFLRAYINTHPKSVDKLLGDTHASGRLGKVSWNISELVSVGLNLDNRVGDLILAGIDFSNPGTMKTFILALTDHDGGLKTAFQDERLHKFAKARHVMVHRGGRVDRKFAAESKGRWDEGDMLAILPAEIRECIEVTSTIVVQLLGFAKKQKNSP
jgi:hypothetical protein